MLFKSFLSGHVAKLGVDKLLGSRLKADFHLERPSVEVPSLDSCRLLPTSTTGASALKGPSLLTVSLDFKMFSYQKSHRYKGHPLENYRKPIGL